MYETDFIEGNKGDILIAEIAINGDALGIYDFNTKQFTRFMYFSNNTQKRKFMHKSGFQGKFFILSRFSAQ